MTELTALLLVGHSTSRCSHCRRPVLPDSTRHTDVSGWDPQPGAGPG
ncbi:hypothetical protein [Streptomyces boncukensis]|uniref:Uncharacterized protein n=1 Tax=Streptomyces boncukensis TaxID=2711219 RepID=A0A6G4X9J6_9ACTN|nr:hypothetical protein [Streptomyces boncukensis]NGO73530.1 hypothetical protein [Streptomyces boncukensis]